MSEKLVASLVNNIEGLANSGEKVDSALIKEVLLPYCDWLISLGWVRNSIDGSWQ